MAKCVESPSREVIRALEKKLDKCRNQENNPDSEMWVYLQIRIIVIKEDRLYDTRKF